MRKETTVTFRLSSELADRLGVVAKRTGRTKSFYLRQLVSDSIEDLEDLAESIEELQRGGRRWTAADLREELEGATKGEVVAR